MRLIRLLAIAVALIPHAAAAQTLRDVQERSLMSKLERRIEARAMEFDGLTGIYVREMRTGSEIAIDADQPFPAASVIKIFVLATALRALDPEASHELAARDVVGGSGVLQSKPIGTSWRLRELMTLMMSVSDNTATNILIDHATTERINALIRAHAGSITVLKRRMMDARAADSGRENLLTAREVGRFLAAIEAEEVLDRKDASEFHSMMRLSGRTPFRRRLPPDAEIESKPGELEGVRNEAAVFRKRDRSMIVVVLTSHAADEEDAERFLGDVAADCWSTLDRIGRADATGRLRR